VRAVSKGRWLAGFLQSAISRPLRLIAASARLAPNATLTGPPGAIPLLGDQAAERVRCVFS
ncbi:MAG TPA: hypothetical protein VEK74_11235, partial [Burkholderiaceae bacterium]|nr:hypothetical protein [Burkholderiaceae bacterium]